MMGLGNLRIRIRSVISIVGVETHLSLGAATANVLAQPVARHLVPLNLLSRDWKLSSQSLECALTQADEALVQFFLLFFL